MANDYYDSSGVPATGAFGSSAAIRAQYSAIEAGFDLLPALGTANAAVVVDSAGTALGITGGLVISGTLTLAGGFSTTLTATGATAVTLPTTGTMATLAGAESLSNKTLVAVVLGTPASGTLTNCSGLPISSGVSGLGTGIATWLTTPSSANLRAAVSDPTGTGALVFAGGNIGAATATSINGVGYTGTSGKTLTVSASLTLAGTDATVMTFPSTSATIARTDAAQTFTGVQTFSTPIASASIAVMTATVGGRVPTPPNNTTTFLRGDATFAVPIASVDYSQVATNTVSGTPSSVVFTDLSTEDLIIYVSNLAITAGTAQLLLELSSDNGSSYALTSIALSGAAGLDTTGRYNSFFATGLKIGRGAIFGTSSTLNANGPPRANSIVSSQYAFYLSAACNAIRISTSASTFVDGGVLTLYGRG